MQTYPSAVHIPFSSQVLMDYTWEARPVSRNLDTSLDVPPGVAWWILHEPLYRSQGGTWQPSFGDRKIIDWWWARIDPGYVFPMHVDQGHEDRDRVWCAWDDYTPGHVFIINGHNYENYRQGDCVLFRGDEPHAAANIAVPPVPKISLQLVLE